MKTLIIILSLSFFMCCTDKEENFQIETDISKQESALHDAYYYAQQFSCFGDNIKVSKLLIREYSYTLKEVVYSKYYVTKEDILLLETVYVTSTGAHLKVNAQINKGKIESLTLTSTRGDTK